MIFSRQGSILARKLPHFASAAPSCMINLLFVSEIRWRQVSRAHATIHINPRSRRAHVKPAQNSAQITQASFGQHAHIIHCSHEKCTGKNAFARMQITANQMSPPIHINKSDALHRQTCNFLTANDAHDNEARYEQIYILHNHNSIRLRGRAKIYR